jgi:hypothetical protein
MRITTRRARSTPEDPRPGAHQRTISGSRGGLRRLALLSAVALATALLPIRAMTPAPTGCSSLTTTRGRIFVRGEGADDVYGTTVDVALGFVKTAARSGMSASSAMIGTQWIATRPGGS